MEFQSYRGGLELSGPQFSTRGVSVPQRTLFSVWRPFWFVTTCGGIATCIWQVKVRGTAKHPTMHRTSSHNKELSSPKANSVAVYKSRSRSVPYCIADKLLKVKKEKKKMDKQRNLYRIALQSMECYLLTNTILNTAVIIIPCLFPLNAVMYLHCQN